MTDVKNSRLYKTLKKAVRKEDHAELLRMLEIVPKDNFGPSGERFKSKALWRAFWWDQTPQGEKFWYELSRKLQEAGHECW